MWRVLLLSSVLQVPVPGWAQQYPAAPLGPEGQRARSVSLHNLSKQVVVSAEAHMTDGKTRPLTDRPVRVAQAREIVVPASECLDGVTVKLDDGRTLRADNFKECGATRIQVDDSGIHLVSSAR
jgi:hypothetical protein